MSEGVLKGQFIATGIGSVPFDDIDGTCRDIVHHFPSMPFWPQFVQRSYLEDMSVQFSEGLPLLEINERERTIFASSEYSRASALAEFYEHFLAQDLEYFAISKHYAPGLGELLTLLDSEKKGDGLYVKGQTVGPFTFSAGIKNSNGKSVLHDAELLEAMVNGLAVKALWQIRQLSKTGRSPVIFFDEPYLSGFGSAFSPIQRHEVIEILQTIFHYLKENSECLIGIHCCGNTDWPMIIESGPDIISYDAHDYMEHFLLYPDDIMEFLEKGGMVAWGIVPTINATGEESVKDLSDRLREGLHRIREWGMDADTLAARSILTPACGMGTMTRENAKKGIQLLYDLSRTVAN